MHLLISKLLNVAHQYLVSQIWKRNLLCTETSEYGIGSVLMQKDQNDKFRVIAYSSRLLNIVEQNYELTTCESLSVIWSLRHFSEFNIGYKIHVLTEIFKGKNSTGKFARW